VPRGGGGERGLTEQVCGRELREGLQAATRHVNACADGVEGGGRNLPAASERRAKRAKKFKRGDPKSGATSIATFFKSSEPPT
jgi:hypothetical protein